MFLFYKGISAFTCYKVNALKGSVHLKKIKVWTFITNFLFDKVFIFPNQFKMLLWIQKWKNKAKYSNHLILTVEIQNLCHDRTEPNLLNRTRTESEPESNPNRTRTKPGLVRVRFGFDSVQNPNLIRFGSVATQIRNFHSIFKKMKYIIFW